MWYSNGVVAILVMPNPLYYKGLQGINRKFYIFQVLEER